MGLIYFISISHTEKIACEGISKWAKWWHRFSHANQGPLRKSSTLKLLNSVHFVFTLEKLSWKVNIFLSLYQSLSNIPGYAFQLLLDPIIEAFH